MSELPTSNLIHIDINARRAEAASGDHRDGKDAHPVFHSPGGQGRPDAVNTSLVDADRLEAALRKAVDGEVRFDDGSRALYATDGSNYRQVPIGVVVPKTIDDVVNTMKLCRKFKAPVLSRGGGTSLAGECCNVAVVIDWSKYLNNVLEIDPDKKIGRVQPGCVLDDLRRDAEKHGITFGPDPATRTTRLAA
jgi:FAD/FMN-containing dehydrogenase